MRWLAWMSREQWILVISTLTRLSVLSPIVSNITGKLLKCRPDDWTVSWPENVLNGTWSAVSVTKSPAEGHWHWNHCYSNTLSVIWMMGRLHSANLNHVTEPWNSSHTTIKSWRHRSMEQLGLEETQGPGREFSSAHHWWVTCGALGPIQGT